MNTKSTIIKIVIFASGVATGWLVAKRHYETLVEEEIESIRESLGSHERSIKEKEAKKAPTEDGFRANKNIMTRSSLDDNASERAKRNYNLAGTTQSSNEDDEEDDQDEEDDEPRDDAGMSESDIRDLTEVDRTQPYVISDEEFTNEFDHHEKVSLYYYRNDDVLCEENEEILTDVEGTIGYDALSELDTQTTVWVRNEPLCIDYEVIAVNKSYAELVHGVGIEPALSPRERYLKEQKMKRREQREE